MGGSQWSKYGVQEHCKIHPAAISCPRMPGQLMLKLGALMARKVYSVRRTLRVDVLVAEPIALRPGPFCGFVTPVVVLIQCYDSA